MQTHKDLDVWKQGIDLVVDIYKLTAAFPKEELYGLSAQMRRAAVSVPSNIAEGYARNNLGEIVQFLYHSLSSLSELETQIILSEKLGYLTAEPILESVEAIRRKLLNLIRYHKARKQK